MKMTVCLFVCLFLMAYQSLEINAKSNCMQIDLFETIQFSISKLFNCPKHFYFKLFSLDKQI